MNALKQKVLVLNKSWCPVHTVTVKRAISLVASSYKNDEPKANVIDHENGFSETSWYDWIKFDAGNLGIRTVTRSVKIPEIIILTRFNTVRRAKVPFTKNNLLKRDNYTCQFCGKNENLTIDHLTPKSKGGENGWLNCVISCRKCNGKKGNKSLEESGMSLRMKPHLPESNIIFSNPLDSWKNFI